MLAENFLMAVESCRMRARTMDHSNRTKPTTATSHPKRRARPRGFPEHQFLRDSGIGTEMSSVRASTTFSIANSSHLTWDCDPQAQHFYATNSSDLVHHGSMPLSFEALTENEALLASQHNEQSVSSRHFEDNLGVAGFGGAGGPIISQSGLVAQTAAFHQDLYPSSRQLHPDRPRPQLGYGHSTVQPPQNTPTHYRQSPCPDNVDFSNTSHGPLQSSNLFF